MRVWLHIGLQKTGTTSLQAWCAQEEQALAARGLLYLRPRQDRAGSGPLVQALDADAPRAGRIIARYRKAIAAHPQAADALISSEDFSAHPPALARPLVDALAGHDLRIVLWLRRQDRMAESIYKQMVRYHAGGLSLAAFWRSAPARLLHYDRLLDDWQAAFPDVPLLPQVYAEPDEGPASDSIRAMLHLIGRPDLVPPGSAALRENLSPRAEMVALYNSLPAADARAVRRAGRRIIREFGEVAVGRDDLFDTALRQDILARHAEGNRRVAAGWFPDRAALFPPPQAAAPAPAPDLPSAMIDRFRAHFDEIRRQLDTRPDT